MTVSEDTKILCIGDITKPDVCLEKRFENSTLYYDNFQKILYLDKIKNCDHQWVHGFDVLASSVVSLALVGSPRCSLSSQSVFALRLAFFFLKVKNVTFIKCLFETKHLLAMSDCDVFNAVIGTIAYIGSTLGTRLEDYERILCSVCDKENTKGLSINSAYYIFTRRVIDYFVTLSVDKCQNYQDFITSPCFGFSVAHKMRFKLQSATEMRLLNIIEPFTDKNTAFLSTLSIIPYAESFFIKNQKHWVEFENYLIGLGYNLTLTEIVAHYAYSLYKNDLRFPPDVEQILSSASLYKNNLSEKSNAMALAYSIHNNLFDSHAIAAVKQRITTHTVYNVVNFLNKPCSTFEKYFLVSSYGAAAEIYIRRFGAESTTICGFLKNRYKIATNYALITKKRVLEAEKKIAMLPDYAAIYASSGCRGRWYELENEILEYPSLAIIYHRGTFNGNRWVELEEKIFSTTDENGKQTISMTLNSKKSSFLKLFNSRRWSNEYIKSLTERSEILERWLLATLVSSNSSNSKLTLDRTPYSLNIVYDYIEKSILSKSERWYELEDFIFSESAKKHKHHANIKKSYLTMANMLLNDQDRAEILLND